VPDLLWELKRLSLTREERKTVSLIEAKGDKVTKTDVAALVNLCQDKVMDYCHVAYSGEWVLCVAVDFSMLEDSGCLKVGDLNDVPKGYSGDVLETNDHGNASLYHYSCGRGRLIWDVV
jgi:hypothetical protein